MAEILGPRTILSHALPTGVDATTLQKWQMRSGVSWAEFLTRTANALGAFNQEMVSRWGDLMYLTEDLMMEYPNGGSITKSVVITELDTVDPRHETTIAHMLPLDTYGDALGGTRRGYRDARDAQLRADVRGIVNRLRETFEQGLLTRLFSNAETTIGSAGYSVPFVRGTGGVVDYAPLFHNGETFTTSHNHFLGVDDNTYDYDDMLEQMAETLQEHGHEPPYTAIVSRADIATIKALTAYVQPLSSNIVLVDRAGATTGPQFFAGPAGTELGRIGWYESMYGSIELRATNRVPTTFAALFKSYGSQSESNPLAVRVHPDEGWGAKIVSFSSNDARYPIEYMRVEMEYGIGVGMDRTNGVAAKLVAGGAWGNPTIS